MLSIVKIEVMLLDKKINIKNSVIDCLRFKELNWYSQVRRTNEERLPQKMLVFTWKKKKRKTSKFVDAGSNNWSER